jgi:hypothetical protein
MATTANEVKYLLLPITIKVDPGEVGSPQEAAVIVGGYLAKGFTIIATTITNVGPEGMTVAHVLAK